MLQLAAILFGLVFLLVGVLGFVPGVTTNHMLFGIFHVNGAHNVVHLLSGLVALLAGTAGAGSSRTFFRVFGALYGAVAVLGFIVGNGPIFGLISNNPAVTWLHVGISAVALALGYLVPVPHDGHAEPIDVHGHQPAPHHR